MAYKPQFDFSDYQSTNPTRPLPGHELDVELWNISDDVTGLRTDLKKIQRSDGGLQNGIVNFETLAPDVIPRLLISQGGQTATFATRADAVAAAASGELGGSSEVQMFVAGGLGYVRAPGVSTLPDLPGWRPLAPASSAHWGMQPGMTDQSAPASAMFGYCAATGTPLEVEPGDYGFTSINANVSGGRFDISAPRGPARFVQLPSRVPTAMAVQFGGGNVITTSLAATALAGGNTLTLASATGVQAGDTVYVRLSRLLEGDHRFDATRSYSQLCRVTAVNGNVVTIADPLVFDMPVGVIATGTAQAGAAGTITLAASTSLTELDVKGYELRITGGAGVGQEKFIHTYNATTKVADIGTSYTGVPQAAFSPVPNATSTYQIVAEVAVEVYRPARGSIRDLEFLGYPENGVVVYGGQFARWDGGVFENLRFSDFANHGLYTARNYKSQVRDCRFDRANYALADGGGLGYGHIDQIGYCNKVINCHATGCRTGFDNGATTLFLERVGCTVTGGGKTYAGLDFWPAAGGVTNSGISSHTGSYGCVDRGCFVRDVWFNKIRAQEYLAQANRFAGEFGNNGVFQVSYSPSCEILENTYTDLFTALPSERTNTTFNEAGQSVVGYPSTFVRPDFFVSIRHSTMPKNSSARIARNSAKGLAQSLVYLDEASATAFDLALHVLNNTFSIVSSVANILAVIKASGALAMRQLWAWGNAFSIGGATLGGVTADNYTPYPVIGNLVAGVEPVRLGESKYVAILSDDTATVIPAASHAVKRAMVHVYEYNAAVTNNFCGVVLNGSATPVATISNSGVGLYTSSLAGTTGTDGQINLSVRADGPYYLENRTGGARVIAVEMSRPWD